MDLHEHFLNNQHDDDWQDYNDFYAEQDREKERLIEEERIQEEAEAITNHNRLLLEHENREQERILKYKMEKKVYGTTYSLEATVSLTKSH